MSRQRMTWTDAGVSRHASEHPATPDEGPASPAHLAEPAADAYATGDTSAWAEDPHPGPYPNSAHPAMPDEGPASPAHKAAALERKAAKCIRLATAMLGDSASVASIENQALALMDLPDRSIKASLSRLAEDADEAIDEDDAAAAEADLAEEPKKKASVSDRIARLERVLVKLAESEDPDGDDDDDDESEDPEGDDDDEGSEDPGDDESMMDKKASPMERRMDRIERVLHRLAGGESKGDESKDHLDYEGKKKADFAPGHVAPGGWDPGRTEESMLDEMMVEEMLEEEGMMDKMSRKPWGSLGVSPTDDQPYGDRDSQTKEYQDLYNEAYYEKVTKKADDEMLAEMLEEEGMSHSEESMEEMMLEEMMLEEGMGQNDPESFYGDDPSGDGVPQITEVEGVVESMGMDPMGMDPMGLDEHVVEEDDMMVLASLFGKDASKKDEDKDEDKAEKEDHDAGAVADDKDHIKKLEKDEAEDAKDLKEEESKKAALRPQPKRASRGAKTLGGVSKAASSEVGDLSKLWESAPDVSRFF